MEDPPPSPPSDAQPRPEGCGRLALSGLAALGVFLASLTLAELAQSAVPGAGAPGFGVPTWAGAGLLAALAVGLVAPRRSLLLGLPLVLVLEWGCALVLATFMAMGDYYAPASLWEGAGLGSILALVGIMVMRATPPRRRLLLLVGAFVLYPLALFVSATLGSHDLAAGAGQSGGEFGIVPAVERILREDILVQPGPIAWEPAQHRTWSSGETVVQVYGDMSAPRLGISVEVRPGELPTTARSPLRLKELRLDFPILHELKRGEALEAYSAQLRERGLKPELVARFRPQGDVLVATHHGLEYRLDPAKVSSTKHIELTSMLLITGTYDPAAP